MWCLCSVFLKVGSTSLPQVAAGLLFFFLAARSIWSCLNALITKESYSKGLFTVFEDILLVYIPPNYPLTDHHVLQLYKENCKLIWVELSIKCQKKDQIDVFKCRISSDQQSKSKDIRDLTHESIKLSHLRGYKWQILGIFAFLLNVFTHTWPEFKLNVQL